MPDDLQDGTLLPSTLHAWPDERNGPWSVTLHWKVLDGRAECVGVDIASTDVGNGRPPTLGRGNGLPVTGTVLRNIGLPERIAADRMAMAALLPASQGEQYAPAGMRRSTADRHRLVAKVYRDAIARGDKPIKAVAAELGVTEASASTIVARARSAGFLGPTSPGVPMG